jgi:5'-3' exonuclease
MLNSAMKISGLIIIMLCVASTFVRSYNVLHKRINNKKLSSIKRYASDISSKIENINYNSFTYEQLPDETLYIIDGTSMLFTSYFSRYNQNELKDCYLTQELSVKVLKDIKINPEDESSFEQAVALYDGLVPCGALTAMMHNFARFIKDVKPRYVVAAFDAGKGTFRHEIYPEYKRQRAAPPPEILPLFRLAPQMLEIAGCKCFTCPGYEADDIMATLSKWARDKGLNVVHVSADKDMYQLIEPGVHVMTPWNREIVGPQDVEEKFGVPPHLLRELHSLVGDKADGVPGVKGIGLKTASALVKQYLTVENLYTSLGIKVNYKPMASAREILANQPLLEESIQMKSSKRTIKTIKKEILYNQLADRIINVDDAINKIAAGLQGVQVDPKSTLRKLLSCSTDELITFKKLITLDDNVPMEGINGGNIHSTSYFRYIGESDGASEQLMAMSTSLQAPLALLRQQYHKLDRII